ncbi:putative Transmembrane protein [Melia azedarach]|uniref:Transmembrane protein n=1 Tax=Melia azedarach TaxID=155640 RepID=A0ACC1X057_MELAZ|nr:putative Transmembrane protein [Melia azedarach]
MELKSTFTIFFLLFLLLASPFLSTGGTVELGSEVYEIDYRGPETHSSIPPPDHSSGKPTVHRESTAMAPKCKGLRGCNVGGNAKKIHG